MSEEQPERASDVTISPARDLPEGDGRSDARGHMRRFKRLMADDDARAFLRSRELRTWAPSTSAVGRMSFR